MKRKKILTRLVVCLFLTFGCHQAFAQANFWEQTSGPGGGIVQSLAFNSSGHIFAGTIGGGAFRSTNNGDSWTVINTGIPFIGSGNSYIYAFAFNAAGHIFAATGDRVLRSTNNGDSWTRVSAGLTSNLINALAISPNGHIFAGSTGGGIFRSTDNGNNWSAVNTGLTNLNIGSLVINSNGHIFAGSANGVFRSTDNGGNWTVVNTGLTNTSIRSLIINSSGHLFVGTPSGIFRSTDNGGSWTVINAGLTSTNVNLLAISPSGEILALTVSSQFFRSSNNGDNWTQLNTTGLTNRDVRSLAINANGHLFVGTYGGVFRSTDNGSTLAPVNTGLTANFVNALAINRNEHVFAGTINGIFRSLDNGGNWTQVYPAFALSLAINTSGHIFAGIAGVGVVRSTDNGNSWRNANAGISNTNVQALAINVSGHLLAANGLGVFRSIDNGENWSAVNNGLTSLDIRAFAINSSGQIFAGSFAGSVFRSTDNGDTWISASSGLTNSSVYALAINAAGDIFAGTVGGIFRSTDNGGNWARLNTGLTTSFVASLAINSRGHIYAGTFGSIGGVFLSTNNGNSWTQVSTGLTNPLVVSLAINSKGDIFAGTQGSSVFRHLMPPPPVPNFKPEVAASQLIGNEFFVDVAVDTVENLFGVSFELNYTNTSFIDVVTPTNDNVMAGPLLGNDLVFISNLDEAAGKVGIGISRKAGQGGVTGRGVVARIKFKSLDTTPAGTAVEFSLSQVTAIDPANMPIKIMAVNATTTITGLTVWPGDTNNDGRVNQADVLPIGLHWNKTGPQRPNASNTWQGQLVAPWSPEAATYADANGDGVVNQGDVLPIGLNWGRTHTSTALMVGGAGNTSAVSTAGAANLSVEISGEGKPNEEIWLQIKAERVTNLFGIAFELQYSPDMGELLAVEPGNFLGEEIIFFPNIDRSASKLSLGISRKAPFEGVSGSGVVARIKMRKATNAPVDQTVSVTLQNVMANDPSGAPIMIKAMGRLEEAQTTESAPTVFALHANSPNPFNPSTTIKYDLPQTVAVELQIFDRLGRRVRTLVNQLQPAGRYAITWDGRNELGQAIASGVYFYRLRAGEFARTKKLTVVK